MLSFYNKAMYDVTKGTDTWSTCPSYLVMYDPGLWFADNPLKHGATF